MINSCSVLPVDKVELMHAKPCPLSVIDIRPAASANTQIKECEMLLFPNLRTMRRLDHEIIERS